MTEQQIENLERLEPTYRERTVLSKRQLKRKMPPVGFRRIFRPEESAFLERDTWGEVIYVHLEHLYYLVRYNGCGLIEAYSPVAGDLYKSSESKYNRSKRRGGYN